ncbi:HEAT repeat domain-containing protein [Rubrivirga marina]|uniref:HEAT repeat domain-containing protein n=1 Tax=Rubrivirga marina TaxID=1196024 RepID=A0A271J2A9_9BACT|nr:HEAT repeat domain-containing protein [Rubrivirga marina]PAP77095.1 hypothetical protein BSZ37_11990 [Rubrivirga marina]
MTPFPPADFVDAAATGLLVLTVVALALTALVVVVHVAADRAESRRAERWARWERALLDALVGERPPSSLGPLVGDGERGDYFQLLIAYALRLGGESRAVFAEAAAPHLDTARQWLCDRRADRRALAAHLFGLVGSVPDLHRLVPLLHDPAPEVGMITARALGRSRDLRYLRPVVGALDGFEAWGSPAVASALTLFGIEAGPTLEAGLASPELSESARTACAEALRRLGYVPAGDTAAALLSESEPPREVQAAALRLLRDVGGPGHADAARALLHHGDEVVRLHAISALSALSIRPDDAARIEHALADPSPWVALRAARGLVEAGRTAPLQAIAEGDAPCAGVARQALAEAGFLAPAT